MASSYFKNFPTIVYNNSLITNIIARAKIDSSVRDKTAVFFPYTIREGERPDTIANNYYDDPNFAWLIYYANQVIDPYFEWPLSTNEFLKFIQGKYGSVAKAQDTIAFFRNNWEVDDTIISPGAYNSLPGSLKKYWAPIFDYKNGIISYERAKLDTVLETNFVVEIQHNGTTPFQNEEIVKQGSASAIVSGVSSGIILVEKIQGSFTTGAITNYSGDQTATATSVTILNQPTPSNELGYYSPVSAYDYEDELNEQRKEIYILDKSYLNQIELEMKTLLV